MSFLKLGRVNDPANGTGPRLRGCLLESTKPSPGSISPFRAGSIRTQDSIDYLSGTMDIQKTKYSEIDILKNWFPDQKSSYFWCGPGLRFPYTHDSFLEDIHWQNMPAYSLLDDSGQFVGFGQYYEKAGRCHLARLAISPGIRGKGHGQWFISRLMNIGMKDLGANECSLFVINDNAKALRCYVALGFKKEECPPGYQHFNDIDFMVFKSV